MGVHSLCLTLVVLVLIDTSLANPLMDTSLANPLIEAGIASRTFSQLNMRCGTRSAFKRITMSTPSGSPQNCEYTIRAYSTRVCQVRIDIDYIVLDPPTTTSTRPSASCTGGRLTIQGMPFDLCGTVHGTHVYVPFDAKSITSEMKINFQVGSGSFNVWNMEINQIECSHRAALVTYDQRQAPDGCLQYFYEPDGRVESFNFAGPGPYYGGTHYAICFKRNYNDNAMLELTDITFNMDNVGSGTVAGFDDDCLTSVSTESKDYIAIPFAEVPGEEPHSLFCGDSLDGKDLTFRGAGPIVIHVNTDRLFETTGTETGFEFSYKIR